MSDPSLLIVGASARAVAQSAVRAGLRVTAIDLFADRDLQAIAHVRRISDYPAGIVAAAADLPPGPWIYLGAIENHPALVAALSGQRTLLGNGPDALRAVRDPWQVAAVAQASGLSWPQCRPHDDPPASGAWVLKPLASGGGRNLKLIEAPPDLSDSPPSPRCYWQAYIPGDSVSALYLAERDTTHWLGATEQLVGTPWTSAAPFHYAGSLGPLLLSARQAEQFRRWGDVLASAFGLIGVFGIDAIVTPRGDVVAVEINPRLTASSEIWERVHAQSLVAWHCAACRGEAVSPAASLDTAVERFAGKAIVFACEPIRISAHFVAWCAALNATSKLPTLADLPSSGTQIVRGDPILTVLADGDCIEQVRIRLRHLVAEVRQQAQR